MTTGPHHPGDTPQAAAEDLPREGEDLGALLTRELDTVGRTQKDLAAAAGITYSTLNHWIKGTRGTSRVDPEDFRRLAKALRNWGSQIRAGDVFRAAGRQVPGPSSAEREQRLLSIYRALPVGSQRALIQHAELLARSG
ncbi:helix-turn-helix domain-containing protein [Streptomyces albipurpureus]|uniref:Helix-turn-helix domain-containing protein n=1 Tax=Streptomyces albipurpureus TaxID=2897419 RepID=A0ABT0V4M7_9ACTN|nr:helix-turn-helix domain-containing protein [Streptomyces sp. CWNU-1]MCM2394331.1 helix-turn-helix domain-containing protein [Streptomyces sp. CWNU-1]